MHIAYLSSKDRATLLFKSLTLVRGGAGADNATEVPAELLPVTEDNPVNSTLSTKVPEENLVLTRRVCNKTWAFTDSAIWSIRW
eukprot:179208-Prorocentrum_minimum.AAC.1